MAAVTSRPAPADSWLPFGVLEPHSVTLPAGSLEVQPGPGRLAYCRIVPTDEFSIVCEVEPATRADLMQVRQQIGVMSRIASSFLIPDNHIGRATVSSIAVAHEVALMGGRAIACLNARDRNVLGFRRDLLTAAAYGVDEFLFVYGDRPETVGGPTTSPCAHARGGPPVRFGRRTSRPSHSASVSAHPWARCRRGSGRPTSCSSR